MSNAVYISPIEVLALKKLAVVGGALAQQLSPKARTEQNALVRVLIDVTDRADLANKISAAKAENCSAGSSTPAPSSHASLERTGEHE